MSRRRQGRELALGCLYAHHSTGQPIDDVFAGQAKRMTYDRDTEDYARRLFKAAIEHGEEIDQAIRESAVNWDFARIGHVEKNILRLAIAEMRFFLDTPAKVVINEALELARAYVDEESRAFINGILDRVYKSETGHANDDGGEAATGLEKARRSTKAHRGPSKE
jgi:N utilization substance protein B